MKTRILGIICIIVLCAILTLGLWPFHSPENNVSWLGNRNGLQFGRYSSLLSSGALKTTASSRDGTGSIEIWLQPRRIWDSGSLLALYLPKNPFYFSLRQSQKDARLQADIQNEGKNAGTARLYVKGVFRKASPVFLTITSGQLGTRVYIDGVLAKTVPQLRLFPSDFTGRLVVGDSPGQTDSWSGQLLGLAFYDQELTPPEVLKHQRTWTQTGLPEILEAERSVALYLLDEHSGNVIHNRAGSDGDLYIPEKYVVADQIFLEPFWKEFSMSRSYWDAALKNLIGFVPLGFCFYAYLSAVLRIKRSTITTVVLGTMISLTIEILQAFLPTRDSGTTDLFTNTLGTWIGVASYKIAGPLLVRIFPWLPLASPSGG